MDQLSLNDLPSGRTVDELLAATRRRGLQIRHRRRRMRQARPVLALAMALVVVGLAASQALDDDRSRLRATAPAEETPAEVVEPTTTTSSDGAGAGDRDGDGDASTTTSSTTTTTGAAAGGTTLPPNETTTTTAALRYEGCKQEHVTVTITTDRASYLPGEPVAITAAYRNNGPEPCWSYLNGGYQVIDSEGRADGNANDWMSDRSCPCDPLRPGEESVNTYVWRQDWCADDQPCRQAAPGRYTVRAYWGNGRVDIEGRSSSSFTLGTG